MALWLFGSLARGGATPISDVDLAYLTEQDIAEKALERFENRLYRLISSTLATDEISLLNMRRTPTFLCWQVLTEGVLLFCRDEGEVASLAKKFIVKLRVSNGSAHLATGNFWRLLR